MSGKALIITLLVLLSLGQAGAQEIIKYDVRIDAQGTVLKDSVTLSIRNNHQTSLRRITYPFSTKIEGLKTYDSEGGLESKIEERGGKNYVTTELREPLGTDENATILYEFEDTESVTFFEDTYFLSTSFPLLANVRNFGLTIRLPEGTGLSNPDVDLVPAPSEITSDGRAVILRWRENDPSEFRVFVKYEILRPTSTNTTTTTSMAPATTSPRPQYLFGDWLMLFLTILLLFIFSALLVLKFREKKGLEEKIDILKDDEQLILKLVAEVDGIAQREIQRRTDFSKTKVSKILAELEKRGVIKKVSMGKKNKVYLTQKLKE